jgi:hypothetical protein
MHYEAAGDLEHAVQSLREASLSAENRQAFAEATELMERALRIAEGKGRISGVETPSELNARLDGMRTDLQRLYARPLTAGAMA